MSLDVLFWASGIQLRLWEGASVTICYIFDSISSMKEAYVNAEAEGHATSTEGTTIAIIPVKTTARRKRLYLVL